MRKTTLVLLVVGLGTTSHCNGTTPPTPRRAGSGNVNEVAACDDGSAAACHAIGLKWAKAKNHPQSKFQSWKHFKMACEGGHAPGCQQLKALNEAACFDGLAKGCLNLGELYRLGKKGIPANLTLARRYLWTACRDGVARACYELGVLWNQGGGGPLNARKARSFFRKACSGGWDAACARLPRGGRRR
jgi:TPR repeat protein